MGILQGKRGIIFGIANERSYAWFIAKSLKEQGAESIFTYLPMGKMEHRVRGAIDALGVANPWLKPCDVNSDASMDEVFAAVKKDFGTIDYVVHSVAFADKDYLKPGMFHKTPRQAYKDAVDTSAYTLLAMGQRCVSLDLMPQGGSIVSLTYYGGEKVTPGYNVMGIAKAALEHTTRYLAFELGEKNIRVNTISAGPFKTLAGAGVGGMDDMIRYQEFASSMKRCNTGEEVGDTAAYLLSGLSSGVTGETVHVDAGFSIVGVPPKAQAGEALPGK